MKQSFEIGLAAFEWSRSPKLPPNLENQANTVTMILHSGEKIHVIHRRFFEKEARRHFIGLVDYCEGGLARVTGYVYTVDRAKFAFVKRPEKRTRIISLISGDLLVNVIPPHVDIEQVVYKQEGKAVRVTDGSDWHLDLSEVTWS